MKSHNLRHSHFLRILRIHHSKELVTLFISFFFTISWTSSGKTSPRNSWRRRASWTTSGIGKKLQMASPWPLWTMMASCWPLAKPANPWRCAWRARKVKRVPFKPAWKRKAELLKVGQKQGVHTHFGFTFNANSWQPALCFEYVAPWKIRYRRTRQMLWGSKRSH